jgi:hypothetical protein
MVFVGRSVRARVEGTPQPQYRQGFGQPLAQARRGPRVGLVEFAGQRGQLGFGVQGGDGAVGRAHAVLDRAAQPLGQLVADVADLCCWHLASTG